MRKSKSGLHSYGKSVASLSKGKRITLSQGGDTLAEYYLTGQQGTTHTINFTNVPIYITVTEY